MELSSRLLQERIAERAAQSEHDQPRRWLAFLAEASQSLASSLDYETTLASIADLMVPEMADWCTVDLLEGDQLRCLAVSHLEAEKAENARELRRRFPPRKELSAGVWNVLRTGMSELFSEINLEMLERSTYNTEQLEQTLALGMRSVMIVPLKARGRMLGALTFVAGNGRPRYETVDLVLAEELALRCATALDNAQLHSQLTQALIDRELAVRERERLLLERETDRARLELVLQQLPAGVLIAEAPSGNLLFANARAGHILRHPLPLNGSVQAGTLQGFHDDGTPYAPDEWPLVRSLKTGEVVTSEEMAVVRGDGARIVLSSNSAPIRDASGKITASVVTFQDVTDRRKVEEETRQHAAFVERLVGILGHDLRGPLQAISASAHLLLRRGLPEAQTKAAARVASSAERMGRMITDLLDFTRTRLSTGMPVARQYFCLPDVMREIVEEMEMAHPSRRVLIDASEDPCGHWDRDRIAQLVSNLVGNALAYGKRDAPVRLSVQESAGDVVFSVHNEGAPIPASLLPRIFEPFRRAESANDAAARSKGLGLGLYIARQIALVHGGDISVRSTEAEGTTFTVRLPKSGHA